MADGYDIIDEKDIVSVKTHVMVSGLDAESNSNYENNRPEYDSNAVTAEKYIEQDGGGVHNLLKQTNNMIVIMVELTVIINNAPQTKKFVFKISEATSDAFSNGEVITNNNTRYYIMKNNSSYEYEAYVHSALQSIVQQDITFSYNGKQLRNYFPRYYSHGFVQPHQSINYDVGINKALGDVKIMLNIIGKYSISLDIPENQYPKFIRTSRKFVLITEYLDGYVDFDTYVNSSITKKSTVYCMTHNNNNNLDTIRSCDKIYDAVAELNC